MDGVRTRARQLPAILGWLTTGILLALLERWLWPDVWGLTLVVWWAYLTLTAVVLVRLLIESWASRWSPSSRGLVWLFLLLGVLLLWAHPLITSAGKTIAPVESESPARAGTRLG